MKIIILHGWTKYPNKWQEFISVLGEKGIKIEFPKIPGLSEKLNEVWKLDNYVNWLNEIVGNEKVILLGHSNGGRIALAFTNRYPEKIEKLILIDSAGIYHNELPIKIKRIIFGTIAKLGRKLTSSEKMKNLLYKFTHESDYKDLDERTKKTMLNLITSDLRPILPQIKIPTLIIWGDQDETTPLSDGTLMNSLIPNSKLKVIKDARHSPQYTNVDEVIKAISDFI